MFRFPADETRRKQWLEALKLSEAEVGEHSRICSRHFLHGDPSNTSSLDIGKRFASPKKISTDRGMRAVKRATSLSLTTNKAKRSAVTPSSSRASSVSAPTPESTSDEDPMSVSVREPLLSDYSIHELPLVSDDKPCDTALAARVELLEAETAYLRSLVGKETVSLHFQLEQIADDDSLIQFYTGFASYSLLLNFFEFLGPAMYKLNYWVDQTRKTSRRRKVKPLSPLNQFFLTLVKLKLNLRVLDLARRFGVSRSLVSKYFITWVCFLYQHLNEIDWTPSAEQVASTLPCVFQEKYPMTYSIIDASEIFIETPSDLFVQSSTWSNYKHHNTGKFLIGCTPNGAVLYVSQLYVGSISDVELTKVSGYLETLDGKEGVSVMADRGFTVRDLLEKGISLNIPPFMDGKQQLTPEEIQRGHQIASVRIHVERTIGRIKNYVILKGTFPNTVIRLVNQIVSVCAWLTNFQPALIPLQVTLVLRRKWVATSRPSRTVTMIQIQNQVKNHQKWQR